MKDILKFLLIGLASVLGVQIAGFAADKITNPQSNTQFSLMGLFQSIFSVSGALLTVLTGIAFVLMSKVFGKKNLTP